MPLTQDVFDGLKSQTAALIGEVYKQKGLEKQSRNGAALAVMHTDLKKVFAWLCHEVLPNENLGKSKED